MLENWIWVSSISNKQEYSSRPTVWLFAPGSLSAASVPVVRHACDSAHWIGRPALLSLPTPLLVLPAEAALGDLQPVSVAVVPSVEAAVGAVESVAAVSTRAVSVEGQKRERFYLRTPIYKNSAVLEVISSPHLWGTLLSESSEEPEDEGCCKAENLFRVLVAGRPPDSGPANENIHITRVQFQLWGAQLDTY